LFLLQAVIPAVSHGTLGVGTRRKIGAMEDKTFYFHKFKYNTERFS